MSIDATKLVWEHSQATGTPRLVMLALADNANADGFAWPGHKTIADMCLCSERQVSRIIAELEAGRELYVERGVGRKNYTRYLITINVSADELSRRMVQYLGYSPTQAVAAAAAHLEKGDISGEKATQLSTFPEPEKGDISGEKVTSEAEKVTFWARKGDIAVSPDPTEIQYDPVVDDDRARATPPPPSSSSSPPPAERIRLPAKALAALVEPRDPAYVAACAAWGRHMSGTLTPLLEQEIKLALQTYPPEWLPLAMETAAGRGKRFWGYVAGILRAWQTEGVNHASRQAGARPSSKSRGYGRTLQPAPAAKKGAIDYATDPDFQEFLAGFRDISDTSRDAGCPAAD